MDADFLMQRAMYLIPLILSLTIHEYAHAWSAFKLGDDTAARMGRLTLNPLVHMDPIGTFLLPLMGIPFGWAKPVPVVAARFRRDVKMTTGMMITAAAGPVSNMVLAVLCVLIFGLTARWYRAGLEDYPALVHFLAVAIQMNVALAIFNMLPIPPLDGSRVMEGLLPDKYRPHWERFVSLSPLLLVAVIVFGGPIIAGPTRIANQLLNQLLRAIAG